ncbi:MAG: hypothetical protein A2Y40_07825 [Candidatus Margulisbacteria bacterium GWF2_35_9]|nr:MAG: hypothetical protein A2Y40_07825 [Candidatus Margulisbacteria bacterium GWF2_35_9]
MRIQKYLSSEGILSRRKTEEYLLKGWIKVNGEVVTEPGRKIDPEKDIVELSEELIQLKQDYRYIKVYKPRGIFTNLPSEGEKEVLDLLPEEYKNLHSVGRLDKDSEGLILFTNDGIFAKQFLNTQDLHEREYIVVVNIEITDEIITQLEEGVFLKGKKTLPSKVVLINSNEFHFILKEGRNRQIRKMINKVGGEVIRLIRIRIGNIVLDNLKPGDYKPLSETEIKSLKHT